MAKEARRQGYLGCIIFPRLILLYYILSRKWSWWCKKFTGIKILSYLHWFLYTFIVHHCSPLRCSWTLLPARFILYIYIIWSACLLRKKPSENGFESLLRKKWLRRVRWVKRPFMFTLNRLHFRKSRRLRLCQIVRAWCSRGATKYSNIILSFLFSTKIPVPSISTS